jgi:hypothetical protein
MRRGLSDLGIPEQDAEFLRTTYETTPHPGVGFSSDDFVRFIRERIRAEYLRDLFDGKTKPADNPLYAEFRDLEIFYEGRRMESNGENTSDLWQEPGLQRRKQRVLTRIVNRTIILLRKTGWDLEQDEDDLRSDLSKYKAVEAA